MLRERERTKKITMEILPTLLGEEKDNEEEKKKTGTRGTRTDKKLLNMRRRIEKSRPIG